MNLHGSNFHHAFSSLFEGGGQEGAFSLLGSWFFPMFINMGLPIHPPPPGFVFAPFRNSPLCVCPLLSEILKYTGMLVHVCTIALSVDLIAWMCRFEYSCCTLAASICTIVYMYMYGTLYICVIYSMGYALSLVPARQPTLSFKALFSCLAGHRGIPIDNDYCEVRTH